jgi:O-antigen ligase
MLQAHPLFGIGAYAWVDKYRTLVAHNSFLHCAAEVGVFGLLPWVLLILLAMKNTWFVSQRGVAIAFGRLGLYAEAILLACLAWTLAAVFVSKTYNALLFILIALSASATNLFIDKSGDKFQVFERRDLIQGVLLMISGLIVFKLFLRAVGQ